MTWTLRGLLVALAAALPTAQAPAQEEQPANEVTAAASAVPVAEVKALEASFEEVRKQWFEDYRAAETDEARKELREKRPKAADWVPRFKALADKHRGTEAEGRALAWIADNTMDAHPEVLERLTAGYVDQPFLADVCRRFRYAESEAARIFLEQCLERSLLDEVKGQACYSLGRLWKQRASMALRMKQDPGYRGRVVEHYGEKLLDLVAEQGEKSCRRKAEELLERVASDHAGLTYFRDRKLGTKAEADLFEMRNLNIGQVAPDIEGESIHGEPMKLSDFRGKVVVLDFWGHW